jgi:hypothetical protein
MTKTKPGMLASSFYMAAIIRYGNKKKKMACSKLLYNRMSLKSFGSMVRTFAALC